MWRVLLNCPCTCLHSFFFTLIFPCTSNYDSICIFSYAFDVSTVTDKISCINIHLSGLTRRRWPARTASWPPPRSSTSTACPRRAASRTSWTSSGSTALLRPLKSVKKFRVSFQIFFIVNTCYRSSLWRARRSGRRRPGPRRGPGWGSHTLTASR